MRARSVSGICLVAAAVFGGPGAAPARAAETALAYIKTDPPGAEVFIDRELEPRGVSPCLVRGLVPGRHTVLARLEGRPDAVGEFDAVAGELAKVELAFGEVEAPPAAPPEAEARPPAAEEGTSPIELVPVEDPGEEPPAPETPGPAEDEEPPDHVDVDCPACRGTGLIKSIGCPHCKGLGTKGWGKCGHCGGNGRLEHVCPGCKGAGQVTAGRTSGTCRLCKGKGHPPCLLCRGRGKIRRPNPAAAGMPTVPCAHCDGSGFEQNVRCKRCGGKGKVSSASEWGRYTRMGCPFCGGDGLGPPVCPRCSGRGYMGSSTTAAPCRTCSGCGHLYRACPRCRGRGWVVER
jgi:hypothetical protein